MFLYAGLERNPNKCWANYQVKCQSTELFIKFKNKSEILCLIVPLLLVGL